MASDDQILAEINKFVTREGECEVWGGYCTFHGTPKLHGCRIGRKTQVNVRKFVWTFHKKAALGQRDNVRSACDHPTCLNIDHLVTHEINRGPDTTPDGKILENIKKRTTVRGECHIWRGIFDDNPYVRMKVNGKFRSGNVHRELWRIIKREELERKTKLETSCSNKRCVNISHIRIAKKPALDWDQIWERMLKSTRREGECLLWTRSLRDDGYGSCTINGKTYSAHLASYMVKMKSSHIQSEINGVRMHVRHTCGNKACVDQSHLEHDTATRNMEDKITHGTTNRGARSNTSTITEETARAIKRSRREIGEEDYEGPSERARRFKVSRAIVNNIDHRRSWYYIPDSNGNTTQNEKYRKQMREYMKEKRNKQWTKDQFESAAKRLFANIEKSSDDSRGTVEGPCWNYTGYTRQGYGSICVHGKRMATHVMACEIKNQRHRKVGETTRHLCGNKKCCSPKHLVFGTPKENSIDTLNHGSKAAKLDAGKVRDIRASALSAKELAKQYGVHVDTIFSARSGKTWSHVT